MGMEKMGTPSPEEQSKIQGERALSDLEMVKGGAQFQEGGRLEATAEQVAGAKEEMKEEMEGDIEKKETAKQEADLKLAELEGRYLEKSKQIGGVNKEFEEKKSRLKWGILRSGGMNVLTLGAAFGVSKFLESRVNKKYQEKLTALKIERQSIDDEKLKIKDPQLYEYEMLNRKYKAGKANLKELLDYNKRGDIPYKIRL